MSLRIERHSGASVERFIPELARLRIEIFREFPYLYEGDTAYEEGYLGRYRECEGAVVVVALDGGRVVGASTGMPLARETEPFRRPFEEAGCDLEAIFYLAESVLEPAYRGRGIGVRFFEEREAHARSCGPFAHATFCAVVRPGDHPLKPPGYRPLDDFWSKRGYRPRPGCTTSFPWKDLGEEGESEKTLAFWWKDLA